MSLGPLVPREFYLQDTLDVGRQLLGKVLVRRDSTGLRVAKIVETESYLGSLDAASHAYRGPTSRNASMFGRPGHVYVYFSYGVHWMLNFVTSPEGVGTAVLIRGLEAVEGIPIMREAMGASDTFPVKQLTNGPAKLAKAFGITRDLFDGVDLCEDRSILTVHEPLQPEPFTIVETTRVGISRNADKPWRFYIAGNEFVSRR
jgi:DNA-3-methyladenine glycosylase